MRTFLHIVFAIAVIVLQVGCANRVLIVSSGFPLEGPGIDLSECTKQGFDVKCILTVSDSLGATLLPEYLHSCERTVNGSPGIILGVETSSGAKFPQNLKDCRQMQDEVWASSRKAFQTAPDSALKIPIMFFGQFREVPPSLPPRAEETVVVDDWTPNLTPELDQTLPSFLESLLSSVVSLFGIRERDIEREVLTVYDANGYRHRFPIEMVRFSESMYALTGSAVILSLVLATYSTEQQKE